MDVDPAKEDSVDRSETSQWIRSSVVRPVAATRTNIEDEEYCMNHAKRGDCHIFVCESFVNTRLGRRDSADTDAFVCGRAFAKLGFTVHQNNNKSKTQYLSILEEASNKDHSDSDAFIVVFMSHGDFKGGQEVLHLYDGEVNADTLWTPFTGDKCLSLAGKPKLFFIQACRGVDVDYGVGLRVSTDSVFRKVTRSAFVVPAQGDLLVMWASYKGMFAFKTERNGIRGSVFIHFLSQVMMEEGTELPLYDLLLKVTRQVALSFESLTSDLRLSRNKQVPQIQSTLMRKVVFRVGPENLV